MKYHQDTIAAIATPPGGGALAIIRVSGNGAIALADKIFRGKSKLQKARSHTVHFGKILAGEDEILDEVLVTVFRAPKSYTRENMVEIGCHGSFYITHKILESIQAEGGRIAEPGEFTKRAFLNGRIDLIQAEAVAEIIKAESKRAHSASIMQLEGKFSNVINAIKYSLVNISANLELELDFSSEGIQLCNRKSIIEEIESINNKLLDMRKSYELGKVIREGLKLVIIGKPNVGKSSILNVLLNENRAIVTEIPGTTRDIIEEKIIINGIIFTVVDTAGIRISEDPVEIEGIRRTKQQIQLADIILFVSDSTTEISDEEIAKLRFFQKEENVLNRLFLVVNKIDLNRSTSIFEKLAEEFDVDVVLISAKNKEGFDALRNKIYQKTNLLKLGLTQERIMITNLRHMKSIESSLSNLERVRSAIMQDLSNEYIAIDIKSVINDLDQIVGTISNDDILNNIFSRFCIGK